MARYGPPDDFNNQPTQYAKFSLGGHRPADPPRPAPPSTPSPPDQVEPPGLLDQEPEPTPWYRKPAVLVSWALLVLVLIALIAYGIIELIGEGQGTGNTPSTTSTTTTSPTTTPPTSTTTTTPTSAPPTTSTAAQQPAPPPHQPTHQLPRRPHLPPLPSVITIPEVPTVITLPPGLTDMG